WWLESDRSPALGSSGRLTELPDGFDVLGAAKSGGHRVHGQVSGAEGAPPVDEVTPVVGGRAGVAQWRIDADRVDISSALRGDLADPLDPLGVLRVGLAQRKPAVAETADALDRRIGETADPDRNALVGKGVQAGVGHRVV